jgi:hypothetical protein
VHEYQPWSGAWLEHGYLRLFDEQYGIPTNPTWANRSAGWRAIASFPS